MDDINLLLLIIPSSTPRGDSSLSHRGDRLRRRHGLVGRRDHAQGEAKGAASAGAQGGRRHPHRSHCHPVSGADGRAGVADLRLSPTLEAFRQNVVTDDRTADQLYRELTARVGSLGWVIEGVVQSIATSDLDAATRLWGDEAIDLLWERELLVSPDGNPSHREVRLADDAQAWASARRTELHLSPAPPRQRTSRLEQLTLTSPAHYRDEQRTRHTVLSGVTR